MATIKARKQANGTTGYTAIVRLRRGKTIIHRESKTFAFRAAAFSWAKHREVELAKPGAVERAQETEFTGVSARLAAHLIWAPRVSRLDALCDPRPNFFFDPSDRLRRHGHPFRESPFFLKLIDRRLAQTGHLKDLHQPQHAHVSGAGRSARARRFRCRSTAITALRLRQHPAA
jgi:hypothetical protein